MSRSLVFLSFVIAFSFSSCYDEFDNTTTIVVEEEPEVFIDAHLVGDLKNLDDESINNFNLVINGKSHNVNDGIINIALEYVQEIGQNISVSTTDGKDAFISKTLVKNDVNYAEIYLFPDLQSHELNTEGIHEIVINHGSRFIVDKQQFNLDPNAQLHIKFRDLSLNTLANQLGQRGKNQTGELQVIEIQNAFHLHFESNKGDIISLKKDEEALLEFSSLSIKENMGLFRYNESSGTWQLVSVIKNENGSIGVNESGYYAFANYLPAVIIESQLILDDKPVAFQLFTIESPGIEIMTRTTISGQWIALLPAEEELELKLTNACGETFASYDIMSGPAHQAIEAISLEGQSDNYLLLDTQVVDCDGELSPSAVTIVSNDENNTQFIFPQQMINTYVPVCNGDLTISATDSQSGEAGPEINWNNSMNDQLSVLSNCAEFEEGFSYVRIEGIEKTFEAFNIGYDGERTILESEEGEFKFTFRGNSTGNYYDQDINIRIDDKNFGEKGYFISCLNSILGCGIENCTVTHYAQESGQWTRLSFSGRLWMQTIDPAVAGYYHIEGMILAKK